MDGRRTYKDKVEKYRELNRKILRECAKVKEWMNGK